MGDEGSYRDWKIYDCLSDFHKNSYDFVGRDVELKNGFSASFLRYRAQNNLVEVFFYSDGSYDEVMNDLEEVRNLLENEAFEPRLYITSIDNAKKGEDVSLGGDIYLDPSSDLQEVAANLDSIVASNFDDLNLIYRKD